MYLSRSNPGPESNKSLDLAESEYKQCEVCSKIDLNEITKYKSGEDGISRGPRHHKSFAELKACAISVGCHICKLFHFVKVESDKQSHQRYKPAISDGQLYLHRTTCTLELSCYTETTRVDQLTFKIITDQSKLGVASSYM